MQAGVDNKYTLNFDALALSWNSGGDFSWWFRRKKYPSLPYWSKSPSHIIPSWVGAALQQAPRVYQDGIHPPDGFSQANLVAHFPQGIPSGGREHTVLHRNLIRKPLVVEPLPAHGLVHVHPVFNHVEDALQH